MGRAKAARRDGFGTSWPMSCAASIHALIVSRTLCSASSASRHPSGQIGHGREEAAAILRSRIIAAARPNLGESDGSIERTRSSVGRPHFEHYPVGRIVTRELEHEREQGSSHALMLPRPGNAQIEQMCLFRGDGHYRVAGDLPPVFYDPAVITRGE